MKIVHVCLSGSYNDNWGYQDNIIPKYNIRDGHEVTIITSTFIDSQNFVGYEKVGSGKYFLENGEKVIRIPFLNSLKIFEKLRYYKGLTLELENEAPDLIFMHGIQFGDMDKIVKYIKLNPSCKLVADNHATFENSAKNFISKNILHKIIWRKRIQRAIPYCNKFFMIAPACADFAEKMYNIPKRKMEYLYLGADVEHIYFDNQQLIRNELRRELGIEQEDFVFITGGKLSAGKNIELLLKSIAKIDNNKLKLIIFGVFSEEIQEKMLNLIKLDKRVIYLGWINSDEVYDYFLTSDAAIFPGTKSALWEQAICSGLPLICKRWTGMEYVDVGGNCLFLDNDTTEEIIENIKKLFNNQEEFLRMKDIALTKGYDRFSYERISRQAININ